MRVIDGVNPEFASFESPRTKFVFPPYLMLALVQWPFDQSAPVQPSPEKKLWKNLENQIIFFQKI